MDNKNTTSNDDVKEKKSLDSSEKIDILEEKVARLMRGEMPIYAEDIKDDKIVFVKMMDGKVVVGWDSEMERNISKMGEPYDIITLHLLGEAGKVEKKKFDYLDFIRNSSRLKSIIIDEKTKTRIDYYGHTTKKYVKGYATIDTGIRVPLRVETPETTYKVKIVEGDLKDMEITILSDYLN